MRRPLIGTVLATSALALLLTACAGGAAPTASPTTAPTSSPTTTPTPTPTSSASVDPNAPANQCADDVLKVEVQYVDAGAGSIDFNVVFTNTGTASCELRGAPGVSVVDASGNELGVPAGREGDENPPTLTVEPGASVSAQLSAVNIDPDGGPLDDCPVVEGTGYRVYPPHSFTGFIVTTGDAVPACNSSTEFLTVGPVQQG